MSNLATDPVGVILGEAVSGTTQERFQDMVAIASVIANRAKQLGTTPQNVVAVRSQFNAYNKALPPGASRYRNLAEQAWSYVQKNGPIHNATYYATPAATKNLPSGLQDVGNTKGHVYFNDPQNRAITTAKGAVTPTTASLNDANTPRGGINFYNPGQSGVNDRMFDALTGLSKEFNSPIGVTSGYRNPSYNRSVGGAKNSMHTHRKAADIDMKGWSTDDRLRAVQELTQRGATGFITYSNTPDMMHVDMRPRDPADGPLFMHDKRAASLSRAPGWMQYAAAFNGLPTPHKNAPTPFSRESVDPNNLRPSSLGTDATPETQIASATPASVMGSGDNLEGGAWGPTAPAPAVEGGAWGRGVVGRAPLGPVTQPAPSMPVSAALNPTRPSVAIGPSATSFAPPSTADLAAAYGEMGRTMQEQGVNRLGTMPAPNAPVAMPQSPPAAGTPQVAVPQQQFPAAPAMPSVPRSLPTNAFPSRPALPPQADFMGNVAGADQFGNTTVTNKYGVTTGMTPQGKQTAYGTGTPGPLGRTSLFGDAKLPGAIGRALPGLLGGLAGAALLGPAGGLVGGLIGQKIGQGINMNSFPSAPSTVGETKGKALSKSERSSISPSASRSMSKNGGRMTGLW